MGGIIRGGGWAWIMGGGWAWLSGWIGLGVKEMWSCGISLERSCVVHYVSGVFFKLLDVSRRV